jgi:methylmalonyl-CoA/ethylmalonyl-CoA epimerase
VTGGPFTGANHVCVVSGDLDRSVRTWADRYGVGPWHLWTKDGSNTSARVDGAASTLSFRVALCTLASGFRIELIQPLDGHGPYAESLAAHDGRDHVHHVRLDVADYDAARAYLASVEPRMPLDATFAGAPGVDGEVRATYFDTRDELGFALEIADVPKGFAMPDPESVYPATVSVKEETP